MELAKYSFGIGDRFGQQGKAQLESLIRASKAGVDITPVWNKSYREHQIIGTQPDDVRKEADTAVAAMGWQGSYFVDADHISVKTVDPFIEASDFFTLDVADYIGEKTDDAEIEAFVALHAEYRGDLAIPGIAEPIQVTDRSIAKIAAKYLYAVREAGRIYRYIAEKKTDPFIVEVSMDETDKPQTPVELLFILSGLAEENIPVQTIAPKFTGRFNKGVDYVGDVERFTTEFRQDLAVIEFAVQEFGLPASLKLSVHSGSDKFAIYGPMQEAIRDFDTGLHLKTAGTTWLEELIGLAEAGGEGLKLAKQIYEQAFQRMGALCKPYATVIDIDKASLPEPDEVSSWDGPRFARALRHDASVEDYNPHFRQLLHVGYKIAADMGKRFLKALKTYEQEVGAQVTENLWERHIQRLFI